MYIDRNEYFLVKSDLKDNIDMVFKRREITAANIARLYGDEVCGSRDTEENIILEIMFYYFTWKRIGKLSDCMIRSVKKETEEIIVNNTKFSRLNEEEYEDFMKLVKELNESDIDVLSDWYC